MSNNLYGTSINKKRHITVFDTTLRDGEQTPGVSLTTEQKLEIARQLDKLCVDSIEAGFPITSEGDKQSVKLIVNENLNLKVCGLARVVEKDIDACIDCGVDIIHTFIPTSDIQRIHTIKKEREEVLEMSQNAVDYIKSHGIECMFSAMDATRTDFDYLKEVYKTVVDVGCDIINVPDTVGIMAPSGIYNLINRLKKEIKGALIDVHCHNDFGLAVANNIMAIEAGAGQVQVTINGIGERAGNASLAETVMSLHSIYEMQTNIKTEYILETSKMVEQYTGIRIPPNTAIVGENAFAHESGIHTHGVLEKSDTFEPGIMTPEMVGAVRRIVLGKHAGRHAIQKSLISAGLHPTTAQMDEIVSRIKNIADKGKRITDADLHSVARVVLGKPKGRKMIVLKELSVMTGNVITPTAVIKVIIDNKEVVISNIGVGPVDAALNVVEEIIKEYTKIKLHDFRIEAISGGADSLAEVIIGVEDEEGRIINARSSSSDIVCASVDALITAINTILQK
ncbi:MAG: 2-isopropylmalate synthase [Methanosarcinaceae archaeon]|jgi:2-isopropylmalate synthase|nr:2-isopropylmalate synthase [Methanosarcinaceae archaeon]NKQ38445.1 2-isopropylmalate synthase [Methanosarcinales archaeon]